MPAKPRPIRNAFDAFIPDQTPGRELESARLLPMERVVPNAHQSRQAFDEKSLAELQASIEAHGVLEPILVRPLDDHYEIVAGERRFRAATLAGLSEIPAIIQELDDTQAAYVTAVENLQREDLDIEDEARQFAFLLQLTGLSQRALAEKLGKDYNYVSRRVRLLKHPELLAAVRAGELTLFEALRTLDKDGGPDERTERADLETVSQRHTGPPTQPTSARWRYVEKAFRELRRIQPATIPREELPLWEKQLQELEEYAASLRRILNQARQRDSGNPPAAVLEESASRA